MNFGTGLTVTERISVVDHDLSGRNDLRECPQKEGYHVIALQNRFQIEPYSSDGEGGNPAQWSPISWASFCPRLPANSSL